MSVGWGGRAVTAFSWQGLMGISTSCYPTVGAAITRSVTRQLAGGSFATGPAVGTRDTTHLEEVTMLDGHDEQHQSAEDTAEQEKVPKDESPSAVALPSTPVKDDSPLGSTDQHSDA